VTQPSSVPPPPPPPAYGGPPPAYGYPPPAPPPGYVPARGSGGPPSGGRVSPMRLILVFVVVLVIGLAVGAAVVLALAPPAKVSDCPDPSVPCGAPPIAPTLPPIAVSSPTPRPSPAATIVRPSGTLVISSAQPSIAPTVAPTATVAPSSTVTPSSTVAPTIPPSAPPSAPPTPSPTPPVAQLPQPRPASNAAPLRIGEVWTSTGMGFQLEYDSNLWKVEDQSANALSLSAGNGAVLISIEGFKSSSSLKSLIQQKINKLTDVILGLTEETAPWRQLPGKPVVGHRQGFGVSMNGTINTPQGPGANVDVVILAASDSTISIRVTVVTADDLRDPAFSVADSILNSIEWPADAQ